MILSSQAFLEKHREEETIPDFQISAHFISNFKQRNRFSSRRPHFKRRTKSSLEYIQNFKAEIIALFNVFDHSYILNADETSWRIFPNGIITCAETGSDSVSVQVQDDDKKVVSVMATIFGASTKFPLYIIAKGKTNRF